MIDSPEFLKTMWGFLGTAILGITGAGYRKVKKIESDIDERPTYSSVEKMISNQVEIIHTKQDYTIKKLEDLHSDVNRLEDIILRGRNDKEK